MSQRKQIAATPQEVTLAKKNAPDVNASTIEVLSRAFEIHSSEDYRRGGEMLRTIAEAKKTWLQGESRIAWGGWNTMVSAAKVVYDMLRDARDATIASLELSQGRYEGVMARWLNSEEAKSRRAELKAAEEILDLEKDAEDLRKAGRQEEAQMAELQMQMISMSASPDPRPKLEGVSVSDGYDIEVTDLKAFLEDVLGGAIPLEGMVMGKLVSLLDVRISLLQEFRKSMGSNFQIRGVKITPKKTFKAKA